MLAKLEAATMIPAKDIEKTRRFYEDTLGFSPVSEDPDGIKYESADGHFFLYTSSYAGTAEHTLIGWLTDDIDQTVDDMSAKGVTFEQYDYPDFKTDAKGIAAFGEGGEGDKGAWFKDPEGNILSIWQKVK